MGAGGAAAFPSGPGRFGLWNRWWDGARWVAWERLPA